MAQWRIRAINRSHHDIVHERVFYHFKKNIRTGKTRPIMGIIHHFDTIHLSLNGHVHLLICTGANGLGGGFLFNSGGRSCNRISCLHVIPTGLLWDVGKICVSHSIYPLADGIIALASKH